MTRRLMTRKGFTDEQREQSIEACTNFANATIGSASIWCIAASAEYDLPLDTLGFIAAQGAISGGLNLACNVLYNMKANAEQRQEFRTIIEEVFAKLETIVDRNAAEQAEAN